MNNHFELFGLAPAYALEVEPLERAYREIQARIHPDRYAQASDAERRASMQWTTRVNEAYRMLRDPVQRGKYLLELHGVDVAFETDTSMPAEFLTRQLELREALEDARAARDPGALERLRAELRAERETLHLALIERIDQRHEYAAAAGLLRKLIFFHKLDAELDAAFETIDENGG